jgi:hypothetical protein
MTRFAIKYVGLKIMKERKKSGDLDVVGMVIKKCSNYDGFEHGCNIEQIYTTLLKTNSCTFCKIHSYSHLKLQTVKNVCETHN